MSPHLPCHWQVAAQANLIASSARPPKWRFAQTRPQPTRLHHLLILVPAFRLTTIVTRSPYPPPPPEPPSKDNTSPILFPYIPSFFWLLPRITSLILLHKVNPA
ncbi:hypothetical protein V2G26_001098 [Clonostachys chloroleuca]